jgi:hypothetical protein
MNKLNKEKTKDLGLGHFSTTQWAGDYKNSSQLYLFYICVFIFLIK